MKHVFIINSHTTFLTSMGTVEYLNIPADEVLFLYKRKYQNTVTPVPYQIIDVTLLANASKDITTKYQEYINMVDEFIDENLKFKYRLYVPHMWHYFFHILYTHPRCKQVSYVQEGGAPYIKVFENDVPVIERVKSFIRHAILKRRTFECKWYLRGTLYKQHVLDSYAINHTYFKYLRSKNHIVKWPSANLNISIDSKSPIFIFDGYVKNGLVEKEIYLSCCKSIIGEHADGKNYVKFHPAQKDEERNNILNFFKINGCEVELMRDDIPMEYIIMQIQGLTFVGFTSSLLYYAHDFGHNVICCEENIIESSPIFRKYKEDCGFLMYHETYDNVKYK